MANVLFKKGSIASLPQSGSNSVVDGALYFAINEDSGNERGKLYLGDSNHKLIPIGEDMILKAVSSMSNLPAAASHAGEFYYIEDGNILAFSAAKSGGGREWVQVNKNTITTLVQSSSALTTTISGGDATVGLTVADNQGTNVTGSFTIEGGNNITISDHSGAIKIDADDTQYTLSAGTGTKSVGGVSKSTVDIKLDDNDSTTTTGDSKVQIYSPNNTVTVAVADSAITLEVNESAIGGVSGVAAGAGAVAADGGAINSAAPEYATRENGFHVTVSSNTASFAANVDPLISVKDKNGNALSATHFVNGTNALDVYSTGAVVSLINDAKANIDAMKYMGTIQYYDDDTKTAAQGDIADKELHNGDVYLATENIPFTGASLAQGSETSAKPGYLVVVGLQSGKSEVNGVIPAGDENYLILKASDTDTTYTLTAISHGISIADSNGTTVGEFTVSGDGTAISVSDTTNPNSETNIRNVQIVHENRRAAANQWELSGGAVTPTTSGSTKTFANIVTAVNVDAQGHVHDITKSTISVTDTITHLTNLTLGASASSDVATISLGVDDDQGDSLSAQMQLASAGHSIQVTKTTATVGQDTVDVVNVDLVWGSF